MEDTLFKGLSLRGVTPVAVSKLPQSKGWVAMIGAHAFIGGDGYGKFQDSCFT